MLVVNLNRETKNTKYFLTSLASWLSFQLYPLYNGLVHKNLMNINIASGRLKNMQNFDEKCTVGVCQRMPKLR